MTGYARTWGRGPDPALLLHCSLASAAIWADLAGALSDRLTMTAPDMVGHGKGPAIDPARDYHDQATEAAGGHLPAAPCHVIGHSYGATVALRLAIEQPSRVRSLILIEPVLFAAADGTDAARAHATAMAGFGPSLEQGDIWAATRIFLAQWGDGGPLDAMPPAMAQAMVARIGVVPAGAPALNEDSARLLLRLVHVRCKVLLLEGAASPPIIGEIHSALARDLPEAQRIVVPEAGHMAPVTHAPQVAAAIRGFLDA